jgi:hypothetical protein
VTTLRQADRWLIEVVVIVVLLLITRSAIEGWRNADASNQYPQVLLVLPPPRPAGGFMTVNAQALNLSQPDRSIVGTAVRYVSGDQRSTGPYVVSVHPIDKSTWAAVAFGCDGKCYGVLASEPDPLTRAQARA